MKKIKMNGNAEIHMMPDEAREIAVTEMKSLRFTKPGEWREHVLAGSQYEKMNVKAGDIVDVPNWWYEMNKDIQISNPVSFDKYKFKGSNRRRPFNLEEAKMHDGLTSDETMLMQPFFELIEDLDQEDKKNKK